MSDFVKVSLIPRMVKQHQEQAELHKRRWERYKAAEHQAKLDLLCAQLHRDFSPELAAHLLAELVDSEYAFEIAYNGAVYTLQQATDRDMWCVARRGGSEHHRVIHVRQSRHMYLDDLLINALVFLAKDGS